jgi:hypothetical protein
VILGVADKQAAQAGSFDEASIVADVSLARVRVFGYPVTGGDVRTIVISRGRNRNGKLQEAFVLEELLAEMDLLLNGTTVDEARGNGLVHGCVPAIRHGVGGALQTQSVDVRRTGEPADEHRTPIATPAAIDDILEEKRVPLVLRDAAAVLPADERLKLTVLIDGPINTAELVVRLERGDELAQVPVRSAALHLRLLPNCLPQYARMCPVLYGRVISRGQHTETPEARSTSDPARAIGPRLGSGERLRRLDELVQVVDRLG